MDAQFTITPDITTFIFSDPAEIRTVNAAAQMSSINLPPPVLPHPSRTVQTSFADIFPTIAAHPSERGRIVPSRPSDAKNPASQTTHVPQYFSLRVFDRAEESIKYLVYTNTWKSFIGDMDDASVASLEMYASRRGSNVGVEGPDRKMRSPDDVEMYELDLEMQAENEEAEADALHAEAQAQAGRLSWGVQGGEGDGWGLGRWVHDGVLEEDGKGAVGPEEVDARCCNCRRKGKGGREKEVQVEVDEVPA